MEGGEYGMWRADALLESMYNEAIGRTKDRQVSMSAEERKGHLKQTLRQLIGEFRSQ